MRSTNKRTWFFMFCLFAVILTSNNLANIISNEEAKTLPLIEAHIEDHTLLVVYHIPKNRHQTLLKEFNFMTVDVEPVSGIVFSNTEYPEGEKDKEGNTTYHGRVILKKPFVIEDTNVTLPDSLHIEAGFQFCTSDGICLAPESVKLSLPFQVQSETMKSVSSAVSQRTIFRLLLHLLFAFMGGMILNIMPCVLPVLSIKILSLVKSSQQNQREILKGSFAYTSGVLISFLILGVVVAGLKLAGQSVGWGFQFQNIGFVVFLTTLIWVFGLSLFDVFIIQLPGAQMATQASGKGGHWGSFITGIFAVLLATPCTAPMLGAALGWTFTQPPWMILLSFLIIGLGLASPFILIGFFPIFAKWMPKPGAWMNTFKEVMAFLLMATVVYLLRVAYFLVDDKVILILWFLLFLAFACWILGKYATPYRSRRTRFLAVIIAIAVSLLSGFHFLHFNGSDAQHPDKDRSGTITLRDPHHSEWYVFSPELLDKLISESKPVFIDFSAEWCLTCKTNETTVLFTQDIQSAFKEKQVHLLRGDYTRKNPMIQTWLEKFNRAGVPLYVFYFPGEEEPSVLPEVITKDMILNEINKIE